MPIDDSYYDALRHKYPYGEFWNDRDTLFALFIDENISYRVIDKKGNYVDANVCEPFIYFSEGLAAASKEGKEGFINEYGETVIDFQFDWAFPFYNERAVVYMGDKAGLINTEGEIIIEPRYKFIQSFIGSECEYTYAYTECFEVFSLEYASRYNALETGYFMQGEQAQYAVFTPMILLTKTATCLYRRSS